MSHPTQSFASHPARACVRRLGGWCWLMLCLSAPSALSTLSGQAFAQTSRFALTPQQQYAQDLRECDAMNPMQDQEACREEARHALAQARKGQLNDANNVPYRANAQARCDVFVGQDLADCLDRLKMPNVEEGSVEEGAVLRERITILPAQ